MRDILTAGSYRTSTGRLHGTNCSCGVSCGPGNGYFCTGFSGGYDTYMCQCDCHDAAARTAGGRA